MWPNCGSVRELAGRELRTQRVACPLNRPFYHPLTFSFGNSTMQIYPITSKSLPLQLTSLLPSFLSFSRRVQALGRWKGQPRPLRAAPSLSGKDGGGGGGDARRRTQSTPYATNSRDGFNGEIRFLITTSSYFNASTKRRIRSFLK